MKFISYAGKFQNFQVSWQIKWSYEQIYMSIQYFINRLSLIVRTVRKTNSAHTSLFSSPYSSIAKAAAIITITAGRPKKFERLVAAGMSSYFIILTGTLNNKI